MRPVTKQPSKKGQRRKQATKQGTTQLTNWLTKRTNQQANTNQQRGRQTNKQSNNQSIKMQNTKTTATRNHVSKKQTGTEAEPRKQTSRRIPSNPTQQTNTHWNFVLMLVIITWRGIAHCVLACSEYGTSKSQATNFATHWQRHGKNYRYDGNSKRSQLYPTTALKN